MSKMTPGEECEYLRRYREIETLLKSIGDDVSYALNSEAPTLGMRKQVLREIKLKIEEEGL